ncbi:hypothetical protein LCGC14_1273700 [marine sediment metagenome]|uniref:Uncharacterized protein n=1 Tax=marine sediment metagenome TaxID=412755 RepID=A0A0F9LII5_9ZZZZ
MALPVESLSQRSTPEQAQQAISASIQQCMQEGGKEQAECQAMVLEIARRQMGSKIRRGLEQ